MINLIIICQGVDCGVAVDLPDAIRDIITQDEAGCVGVEVKVETTPTCDDLTDLVACGRKVSLKEAFLSALVSDGCNRFSLKIFDLTER